MPELRHPKKFMVDESGDTSYLRLCNEDYETLCYFHKDLKLTEKQMIACYVAMLSAHSLGKQSGEISKSNEFRGMVGLPPVEDEFLGEIWVRNVV